jgi:antitoxin component HigA of HigAB toxin-antitoxin module
MDLPLVWQSYSNKKVCIQLTYDKSRVSEIFNRKRKLNLRMIRSLHEKMKIPYESLLADYK